MLTVVLAFLFLIAIGLLWRTREHLTPQGNIQAPAGQEVQDGYRAYSPEQQNQIWSMIPESSRIFMRASYKYTPEVSEIERKGKRDAAWIISNFYKDVYVPAKSPITPGDVDDWVRSGFDGDYPEYNKMLKSYFIDGMPPPPPPASETPQSVAPPVSTPDPASSSASTPVSTPAPVSTQAPESAPPTAPPPVSAPPPPAPPPVSAPPPPAPSPAESSPAPASTSSPTTSTPAPANQTIDVVSPSTITINIRTGS